MCTHTVDMTICGSNLVRARIMHIMSSIMNHHQLYICYASLMIFAIGSDDGDQPGYCTS